MKYKAEVRVELKPGVLDAEGKTVQKSLKLLGYPVNTVKTVHVYDIILESDSIDHAKAEVEDACRRLLANPVIHNYGIGVIEIK